MASTTVTAIRDRFSPDAESVLSLVSGYQNPLSRWLIVLQAMVDDGGTRDGPIFLLGALVAPVGNWVNLTKEWNTELHQSPEMDFFKIQDAIRAPVGLPQSRAHLMEYRIAQLTKIVQRHVTYAVSVELSLTKFNKLFKPLLDHAATQTRDDEKGRLRGISSPYFWAALTMIRAMDYQEFTEPVEMVFDDQGAEGLRVQEWWKDLLVLYNDGQNKKRIPLVQTPPGYKRDQDFAPLQAANSFVWLLNRSLAHQPGDFAVQPPSLNEFLGGIRLTRKYVGSPIIKRWIGDLRKSFRKANTRGK